MRASCKASLYPSKLSLQQIVPHVVTYAGKAKTERTCGEKTKTKP